MVRWVSFAIAALAWACGSSEPASQAHSPSTGLFGASCDSGVWNLPDGGGPCAPMLAQCAEAGATCEPVAACAPVSTSGPLDKYGNYAGPTVCTVHCDSADACAALGGECVTATPGMVPRCKAQ